MSPDNYITGADPGDLDTAMSGDAVEPDSLGQRLHQPLLPRWTAR